MSDSFRPAIATRSRGTAHITLGSDDGGLGLAVALVGEFPTLSADEATSLTEIAHHVCPYSRATRGNVEVTLALAG